MIAHLKHCFFYWVVSACIGLIAGCAGPAVTFTPPAERPASPAEQAWPHNHYLVISYHDVDDTDPDQRFVSVRTDHLIAQLSWLRDHHYQPVTVDQILAAAQGGPALPARAVLLTFDDGYQSFYTRVLPLLQAFNWPAVLAPVGVWLDAPAGATVQFGDERVARDRFLTWPQLRDIADSGLVEIGAHTDNLHYGIQANPQGNVQPAAAVHAYDPATQRYETPSAYRQRLTQDVSRITQKIQQVTGRAPRVWVWPYGEASGEALNIVREHGYELALTLEKGLASTDEPFNVPRMLVAHDPTLPVFTNAVIRMENTPPMRAMQVDLDYVYDPDPQQTERNLDALVQRVADMGVNTVFLQAFADPHGDGRIQSLYFPNRHLPMRADLFNRVAWQLRSRAFVDVYAWMPVLGFDLDASITRVHRWSPESNTPLIDADQYPRLSPFDPDARQRIIEIYEDLARHAIFAGVLFHDDALLSDFEDASPPALAAYRQAGLPTTLAALRADPATWQRWTRFKSQHLIALTDLLTQRVRAIRGPSVRTARNLYVRPILNPESEVWFAQNLDDFLTAYDWTVPMAMPWMENVAQGQELTWLDKLIAQVATRPGGLERTVFELQARDWRLPLDTPEQASWVSAQLADWIRHLQVRGVRHMAYYPDDFIANQPALQLLRPALSTEWYPF